MLSFLKNHPFAVEAFFDSSIVLTFAIPKEAIKHLIPECLEPDIFNAEWAFIAIAMVQTRELRPKGFPKLFGNDFFLIGYRTFVRYTTNAGKRLRGLYILKSQTDKRKMEFFGNIFTHYNYSLIDIQQLSTDNQLEIKSNQSKFSIIIEKNSEEVALPNHSPFSNWKEARRFAGPLPFTFTYFPDKKEVLIIEGVRQNWDPIPLKVIDYTIPFLDELKLENVLLANAFIINNIPYYWKKGKKEIWKP
jgi:hypothetical protein